MSYVSRDNLRKGDQPLSVQQTIMRLFTCNICGRTDARIRECEIETAKITGRAHVDCRGHSEYREVGTGTLAGDHNLLDGSVEVTQ